MARTARAAFAVLGLICCLGLAPAAARAAVSGSASPNFPATVSLGQTGVPASIEVANGNTAPNAGATNTVTALTLVPACSATLGAGCSPAGAEPGVFEIAPTAAGGPGTACAGRIFDVSVIDPTFGTVSFTPRGAPLTLPGAGSSCRIDLTFAVRRLPPADASPFADGPQAIEIVNHVQSSAGLTAAGFGTDITTVDRAATAIATSASPGVALGAGTISDRATVSGLVSPVPGATVQFRLHGPGDSGCATPIFTATAAVDQAGVAVSPPFTPTQAGTHRWVATYAGDANNQPAGGACDDPDENVVVASSTGPRILSAAFESRPRVGRTAVLRVRAVDPLAPVSGLQVRFGEPRGLAGSSTCRVPSFGMSVAPAQLRLPYAFRRAGRHRVTIDVLSGRCAGPVRLNRRTIVVDVAGRRSTAPGAPASRCANGWLIPTAAPATRARFASALLCLVNVQRRKYGRRNLLRSKRLALAAVGHSKDMVRRRYFAHDGPGRSFSARLRKVGYRGVTSGENIAYGTFDSAEVVVRGWMASAGHRSNILYRRFRYTGVGLANGIPDTPRLPGTTSTMDYGVTAR